VVELGTVVWELVSAEVTELGPEVAVVEDWLATTVFLGTLGPEM